MYNIYNLAWEGVLKSCSKLASNFRDFIRYFLYVLIRGIWYYMTRSQGLFFPSLVEDFFIYCLIVLWFYGLHIAIISYLLCCTLHSKIWENKINSLSNIFFKFVSWFMTMINFLAADSIHLGKFLQLSSSIMSFFCYNFKVGML
jgi:hypothetical protein